MAAIALHHAADAEPADRDGLILELIFNFKIFDQVYATTQGGPGGASQTVIMLLYDTAFKYFRFGDASVMAVFVFVALMAITLLQWRYFRKPIEY